MNAKLVETIHVQHPAKYVAGPRIERIEVYEIDGVRTRVEYWYENGRLVRVS